MKLAGIKLLIILLSLMVTSCGVSPVENAQDIPTAVTDTAVSVNLPTQTSESPVPSASPIPTKTITPTVVVPTVPVPTPTWESPLPDIEVKVVEIITSSLDTNRVKGLLAYLDYSDSKNYLFNLSTGEKTLLSEQDAAFFSCGPVSPDRRSLLCQAGDQGGLLLDRQAQIVGRFSWPYEWVYAAGWVNNEWLAFVTRSPQDYPNLLNSPTTLLDLTTQKARLVIPDYPDISILEPFGNIGPLAFTGVSYGPDLELAIYEGYDAEGATWILWDQKAEQKTASIFQAEQMPYPQWSPDGQQAAVAGSDVPYAQKQSDTELYLLSRSNGTQKLTQLGDSFRKFTEIWGLGWSPDGKQLAFLLNRINRHVHRMVVSALSMWRRKS